MLDGLGQGEEQGRKDKITGDAACVWQDGGFYPGASLGHLLPASGTLCLLALEQGKSSDFWTGQSWCAEKS